MKNRIQKLNTLAFSIKIALAAGCAPETNRSLCTEWH
jgi:hypothetical protein